MKYNMLNVLNFQEKIQEIEISCRKFLHILFRDKTPQAKKKYLTGKFTFLIYIFLALVQTALKDRKKSYEEL